MNDPFATIEAGVVRFVRRRHRFRAVNIIGVGLALMLGWILCCSAADRFVRFSSAARFATLPVAVLFGLLAILRAVLLLRRPVDFAKAGAMIERRRGDLRERLLTVLTQRAFPEPLRASADMLRALAEEVAAEVRRSPPADLVTLAAVRPAGILFSGAIALALGFSATIGGGFPRLLARQVMPWANLPPVTTTMIEVPDGSRDALPGHAVAIVADVAPDPGAAALWVGPAENDLQPIPMVDAFSGRYTMTLPPLRNSVMFRVTAGDAESRLYVAKLVRPPTLTRLDLQLQTPDGKTQTLDASDGIFGVVRGTHLHANITASDPLSDATITLAGVNVLTEPTASANIRTADFFIARGGPWSINLIGADGTAGSGSHDMRITALPEGSPLPADTITKIPRDYEAATNNYLRALSTTQP